MSDFSIPGTSSSRFDTPSMIEKLMEAERIPLESMKTELEDLKTEKTTWQEVNRKMARLGDAAKAMYGFESPFLERIAESSNASILTASVNRDAEEQSFDLTVKQIASPDRFISDSLDRNFEVKAGEYSFRLGEDEVDIRFRGGSLQDLAETINRRSRGLVKASVYRDTSDTLIISIEGGKTGSSNALEFLGDAKSFALEAGVLEPARTESRDISLASVRPLSQNSEAELTGGTLVFGPGDAGSISVNQQKSPDIYIEIDYSFRNIPEDETPRDPVPQGPDVPATGSASFSDITIQSANSAFDLPDFTPPPPPPKRVDLDVFQLDLSTGSRSLPPISGQDERDTIRIALSDLDGDIRNFTIQNDNTHGEVTIHSIKVIDESTRGDVKPKNAVSTARDAIIELEGIEIVRETNTIDDLIDDVTLELQKASDEEITLDIKPDRDFIKEKIIEFVASYNELLLEINILTNNDEEIINEVTYLTDDQIDEARDKLGSFQGNITLNTIRNNLKRIVSNPYPTSAGREVSILSQLGISTNSSGFGNFDATRLRGYLEINEDILDQLLATQFEASKEIFGSDTDDDLIVDEGVAFQLQTQARAYTQTGGIFALKTQTIDQAVSRANRDIETFEEKLERIEADYRRKYGIMEGTIEGLEKSSEALRNIGGQQNN
jgi:flagellar hook-associated protein 2